MTGLRSAAAAFVRRHPNAWPAQAALYVLRWSRWIPRGAHAQLFRSFLASAPPRCLHLGSGRNVLPGWLNTDLDARPGRGIAYLDVRRPFPLPDNCCDMVYCEHLIEHLSFAQGARCLRECARILKPGGILRVATPDLRQIARLALGEEEWYLREAARFLHPHFPGVPPLAAVVVNNFFRDWGHQFLYDAETLTHVLATAGFVDVRERAVGESDHRELRAIERHGDVIGERMNRFETLVVEAHAR